MISICAEKPADYDGIEQVLRICFGSESVSASYNEWVLVRKIRQSEDYIPQLSLVAVDNGIVVGYVMFHPCRIGKQVSLALAPLAVHPDYQKKGIGALLVEEGLAIAPSLGYEHSIVLGGPYYMRFGYEPAPSTIYLKNGRNEHLYIKPLKKHALDSVSGQVAYSFPFNDEQGNLL